MNDSLKGALLSGLGVLGTDAVEFDFPRLVEEAARVMSGGPGLKVMFRKIE